MANYIGSGPCEACGSSDALARYSDGSSFCFSCRAYKGAGVLERLKPRKSQEKAVRVIDTTEWQYSLPQRALEWLRQYGITDNEISLYGLRWNPKLLNKQWDGPAGALAMPILENGKVVCVSYRLFDADKPKSITLGYKTYQPLPHCNLLKDGPQNAVVVVEDYVSAMKVSRIMPCVPMLGSALPDEALLNLSKSFKSVYFWLDEDKSVDAIKMAQKASILGLKGRAILTLEDPKCHEDGKIAEIVKSNKKDSDDRK